MVVTTLAALIQVILIIATLAASVILLVFDICVLVEMVRCLRSPEFAAWWRTPPRPITGDRDHLLSMVHTAWRRTQSIFRF